MGFLAFKTHPLYISFNIKIIKFYFFFFALNALIPNKQWRQNIRCGCMPAILLTEVFQSHCHHERESMKHTVNLKCEHFLLVLLHGFPTSVKGSFPTVLV